MNHTYIRVHTYVHNTYVHTYIYNFTVVQVSRVIIVLLLQNCFVYKDHTHKEILTTELLELESWELNTKI